MSITDSIWIGVISGVLTSSLLFVLVQIFRKIILPWYQALIYKGIDISGDWHYDSTRSPQKHVFHFEQHAHKISGTASFIKKNDPKLGEKDYEDIREFKLDGQILERFVYFTLHHSDKQRMGISSHLLEIVGDGRKMKGISATYDIVQHRIASSEREISRDNGLL